MVAEKTAKKFRGPLFSAAPCRVLVAAHSEDSVILGVAVLIQCQGVMNGRTGRHLDDG